MSTVRRPAVAGHFYPGEPTRLATLVEHLLADARRDLAPEQARSPMALITPLIVRDWYRILDYRLTRDGRCPRCGLHIPGRFAETADDFGPRRIPVRIRSG